MFDFYYQQGNSRRKLFQVKGSHCAIGSARSNDLNVNSRLISKRHAEFSLENDGLYIRDLGSMSGTWVNRERVQHYGPLSELDEIEVGDVSVSLRHIAGNAGRFQSNQSRPGFSTSFTAALSMEQNSEVESIPAALGEGADSGFNLNAVSEGDTPAATLLVDSMLNRTVNEAAATMHLPSSEASGQPNNGSNIEGRQRSDRKDAQLKTRAFGGNSTDSVDKALAVSNSVSSRELKNPSRPEPTRTADNGSNLESDQEISRELEQSMIYWGRIVHEQLLFQMDLRRKDVNRMSDDQLRVESSDLIGQIISSVDDQIPERVDRAMLADNVLNESVGLGPLETYLEDESITEIMVNNYREIFVERHGKLERSTVHFSSDETVFAVIERIITPLGRRIDESSPIVDARLKDGSRVNAVIPPLALKGPSLTIRKFPKHRLAFSDLMATDSVSEEMVKFLRVCVEVRKNIIVSGGTGSGKTTLLNVLSNFIPTSDRVVTIEDAAELKLVQPNLVSLESRPANLEGKGEVPIRDLVKNALRMRPDRIVVGECRGGEAIDMLQAMNTGHDGSLTTIHANTPRDVLSRLEVLVLMAGMELPVSAIREQVASAVDLIIQQTRFPCGARKITRITEVVGVESGTVQLQDLFCFDQHGVDKDLRVQGNFTATGAVPTFYESLREIGIEVDLSFFTPSDSRRTV